jgi:trehalose 6-phosphate synthase/phosphatase
MEVLHVGWTGSLLDDDKETIYDSLDQELIDDLVGKLSPNYVPIILDEETAWAHYHCCCKTHLWPIFHYQLWEYVTKDTPSWVQYAKVNQAFADAIIKIWQPGDLSIF